MCERRKRRKEREGVRLHLFLECGTKKCDKKGAMSNPLLKRIGVVQTSIESVQSLET